MSLDRWRLVSWVSPLGSPSVEMTASSSLSVCVLAAASLLPWLLQHVWDEVASTYLSASPYVSVYLRDVGHVELGSERLVVLVRVR